MIREYGTKTYNESLDFQLNKERITDLRMVTCFDTYGVPFATMLKDIQNKRKQTMKNNIKQDPHYYDDSKKQRLDTIMKNQGTFSCRKYYIISKDKLKEIEFKGVIKKDIVLDSSWEVIYYLYKLDLGIDVIRNTQGFEYKVNNKSHYYYPDFIENNSYIEIKADDTIDSKGNLICPDRWKSEQTSKTKQILKYKSEKMQNMHVKIVLFSEIKIMKQKLAERYFNNKTTHLDTFIKSLIRQNFKVQGDYA